MREESQSTYRYPCVHLSVFVVTNN